MYIDDLYIPIPHQGLAMQGDLIFQHSLISLSYNRTYNINIVDVTIHYAGQLLIRSKILSEMFQSEITSYSGSVFRMPYASLLVTVNSVFTMPYASFFVAVKFRKFEV